MAFVLQDIKVNAEIAKALQGFDSRYRQVFEVALDYESGTWGQLAEFCRRIGLHRIFCRIFIFVP